MREAKSSRKGFYNTGRLEENVGLLLKGTGDVVKKGMEKAELLNVFFTLVFTAKSSLQQSLTPRDQKDSLKHRRRVLSGDQVREHLNKLDRHRCMGPGGMHS